MMGSRLVLGLLVLTSVALGGCVASGSTPRPANKPTAADKAANINVQLAIGYLNEGRTELALEKINRALEQNPKSASAHSVAGVINERIGRMQEAERNYSRSVRLAPNDGEILNNYGQFLCKLNRIDDAIDHFIRAVEQPFYDTPDVAMANACFCYYKAGQFAQAEPLCRQAIESNDRNGDAFFLLAKMFLERSDPLRARAFLQRYESIGVDTPESLRLCIQIERVMEDGDAVTDCSRRLRAQFPDSPQAKELDRNKP